MNKTSNSETKRLREAKLRKKEKRSEERKQYYEENKEKINRIRRENRKKAKQLKSAQHASEDTIDATALAKRQRWALYKRQQRLKHNLDNV